MRPLLSLRIHRQAHQTRSALAASPQFQEQQRRKSPCDQLIFFSSSTQGIFREQPDKLGIFHSQSLSCTRMVRKALAAPPSLGSAPSAARIMPSQRHQDPMGFRYLRHLPNASSGASRAWSVQCGNAIPPGADLHPPRLDHRRRLCGSMRRHRLRLESWSLGCKSWVVLGVPSSSRILLYFWDKKGRLACRGNAPCLKLYTVQ